MSSFEPTTATNDVRPTVDRDRTISLVQVASAVLRHRYLVVLVPMFLVLANIGMMSLSGRLTHRTYTASSAFAPQGRAATGGSLAAQIAVGASGGGDPAQSPAFYVELIRTHPMLREVVMTKYIADSTRPQAKTLAEIFQDSPQLSPAIVEDAIARLSAATSVSHNARTNVVVLSVSMPTPLLAQAVNARFLELINRFNLERRQTHAASERRFTEKRLEEVRVELREAEDRLQSFLERNREFRADPSLNFAHDRLMRNVALRSQVVATLAQAHETARIDQARDTPVITIVAHAEPPVFPDPRGLVRSVLLTGLVGTVLGILLALWRDHARFARLRSAEEYKDFDELRTEVATDLTRLVRRSRHRAPTE